MKTYVNPEIQIQEIELQSMLMDLSPFGGGIHIDGGNTPAPEKPGGY